MTIRNSEPRAVPGGDLPSNRQAQATANAEQTYQQAVIVLAQARANRYADTAALFQALGGGWWSQSDAAAAQALTRTLDHD